MNQRFYALSRLSKVQPTADELKAIESFFKSLPSNQATQDEFFAYCKKWKLAPWLYLQMKKFNYFGYLTETTQTSFADFHALIKQQNDNRNIEAAKFLAKFVEQGIDAAVLKGNLLMHTTYMDSGYKKMNDFDMFIHKEDWGRIQDVYLGLGYIPLGFGWGGEKEEPASFSHAGLSFISPNYHCITGTQWGLKSPTSSYELDLEDVWATTKPFDFHGVPIKQLAPEYNLLHLILHMGVHKCGIRDCMDVFNLMQTFPEIDEDRFVEVVEKSNARDKAYFTLQLSDLCADIVPSSLLEKLKPQRKSYLTKRLEKRLALHESSGDMQNAYHDYFHDVEMTTFQFNLNPAFHKRIGAFFKLLRQLFWPRKEIMLRLSDLLPSAPWYKRLIARIKAPYFVFALIAEEIGWLVSFLLLVKLFVDLFLSVKNYFVKSPSYFDYLRSRGINPKEIVHAVKNIE